MLLKLHLVEFPSCSVLELSRLFFLILLLEERQIFACSVPESKAGLCCCVRAKRQSAFF